MELDGYLGLAFVYFPKDRVCVTLACPATHSVDPGSLELRDPPSSAQVLGVKVCSTMLD